KTTKAQRLKLKKHPTTNEEKPALAKTKKTTKHKKKKQKPDNIQQAPGLKNEKNQTKTDAPAQKPNVPPPQLTNTPQPMQATKS
ncbi:hypothetical protein, partial [Staphylococcus aureus]|uniref:hypothetical protein n=1 Tax=Staphylococcus aureus TaxID=1280 RepID=UPI00065BCAAD